MRAVKSLMLTTDGFEVKAHEEGCWVIFRDPGYVRQGFIKWENLHEFTLALIDRSPNHGHGFEELYISLVESDHMYISTRAVNIAKLTRKQTARLIVELCIAPCAAHKV